jgi:hypothetical protein
MSVRRAARPTAAALICSPTRVGSYPNLMSVSEDTYPRLAKNLVEANERRVTQLSQLIEGARLKGVDELLRYLDEVAEAFDSDPPLREISFLVRRAGSDVETSIEATLSGYLSVATDAMRDVMEIEMLLLDFAVNSNHIGEWLGADSQTRWRLFKPAELRGRLRSAGIGRYKNLTRDPDYSAHSEALHVSPRQDPLSAKGLQPEADGFVVPDGGFWEVFEHSRRILFALDALRADVSATAWPGVAQSRDLISFHDACARTQQMQQMYLALMVAPDELRSELGREPTTAEILTRVAEILERQQVDPRLPFAGHGSIRRFFGRIGRMLTKP